MVFKACSILPKQTLHLQIQLVYVPGHAYHPIIAREIKRLDLELAHQFQIDGIVATIKSLLASEIWTSQELLA